MSFVRFPTLVVLATTLAACGGERALVPTAESVDPATRIALEVPLLVDPGLDTQSRRFAVMSDPAPPDGSLPLDDFAPATIAAARAEALEISGGAGAETLRVVPCPSCTAPTLALRTAALGKGCDGKLVADISQAVSMPGSLPIYPRSHLREAGVAEGRCHVKAASFTAPASATAALAFYRVLGEKSGFMLRAARNETTISLIAERATDDARFAVIARPLPKGLSEIDLIVSGL